MNRGVAVFVVFLVAFILLIGVLGLFAAIATAFPTTEEAFFKLGFEIKNVVLGIVSVVVIALSYVVTRLAGNLSVR
jgi:hypothetical protein